MVEIEKVSTELSAADRKDHRLFRLGYKRSEHKVKPGIYSVGSPTSNSPVFVSANLTLSFDALRTSLKGMDAYIMVIDTKGINVWCAAGKGTFGTNEVLRCIKEFGLESVVGHRRLILPQLAAPGVSALEVKKMSGFHVEWGPVRAKDIPEYMRLGKATPEMRKVTFTLRERATVVPVEIVHNLLYLVVAELAVFFILGAIPALAVLVAVMGGVVLFPLLLPYIPTRQFASKGMLLGIILALPFMLYPLFIGGTVDMAFVVNGLTYLLLVAPVVAFISLNYTGSSTFTSRTGVKKEILRWAPIMVLMVIAGIAVQVAFVLLQAGGYL
ncbi:MAG TPA: mercury methylation corrinoid protein HgcA [Methanomassiliicoccales archaeon]|nr:mercury methylation corrinoid protein HgcA [Methanomassiliicoccales archaeon]